MKLNKILMALAATAIVGCTSDDLNELTSKQAAEDSRLIELNENFVLSGVGVEGVATRTHWEQDPETKGLVNKFLPIYSTSASFGSATLDELIDDEGYENVGLCWLGETTGAEVYTNYQFSHFGWLKKGETKAEVDNCDPFNLYNGVAYNEITPTAGTAGEEADETKFTFSTTPIDKSAWELNYNSGVYKTENKTIFGGKYIVYYPYNPEFQKTGTIPAKAVTSFDWDYNDDYESPELGQATFRYSDPVDIEGGMKAANFGLYNLSTLVRLRVFTATAADAYNGEYIDKVVLYSESEKFVKQANLAADKIAAGKQGQELYAKTEGTKTITVNFDPSWPALNTKKLTDVSAYFTVLPTTVDDLVALVHNATSDFWYRVELPAAEFKAGSAKVIDVTVKEADITSDYVAVDQASLEAALAAADLNASESNPQTITVIGDIKLSSDLTIDASYPLYLSNGKYITIDGGAIIVPQNVTLSIETLKEVKSDIRVLGKDCCTLGATGGRLEVNSTSADPKDVITLNNVTLEKTEAKVLNETDFERYNPMVTYQGTGKANIVIADGKKVNVIGGTVKVDRAVEHKGDIEIAKDGKLIVEGATPGDLNFLGSNIVNNGIIEVEKKAHFDITDEDGNASWADGQNMINNGKFIHQVDANVGTTVQNMQQNGEYRCKVDKQQALNDAYVKWTACSVIEMVKSTVSSYDLGSAQKHKGKFVDIEVNNSSAQTIFDGADTKNIEIGNLTVTATSLGLKINYAPNADKEQRELTVHGNMNVLYDSELTQSKKVTVDGNLNVVSGEIAHATLKYKGDSKNKGGLEVKGDIIVTDATFDASEKDALEIKCKNFSLIKKDPAPTVIPEAKFGLRSKGNTKSTMTVGGTISNPKGCEFAMTPASGEDLLAWITCKQLTVGGAFPGGRPQVVE